MRFLKILFVLIILALVSFLGYRHLEPHYLLSAAKKTEQNMFKGPATNAAVQIIEFVDYQCPHCYSVNKIFEETFTMPGLDDVQVVIRPVAFMSDVSFEIGHLVLAAAKQGKGAALHSAILAHKDPITQDQAIDVAKTLGIDVAKMEADARDSSIKDALLYNNDLITKLGFEAVPAFIFDNRFYNPGEGGATATQFRSMIDQVR